MNNYLLGAIGYLCISFTGLHAKGCSQAVQAKRERINVTEGHSLSLSCVVQHCGGKWTGSWIWKTLTDKTFTITDSDSRKVTNEKLSENHTRLVLNFVRVNRSDEGSYGCKVVWPQGDTDMGHLLYVNITAAVPSQRTLLYRVLVCTGALLILPMILGLARCLSSGVKPQPSPRRQSTLVVLYRDQPLLAPEPPPRCKVPEKCTSSSQKASPNNQQQAEVVYADISKDALKQQGATREPAQCTVYSLVNFS